MWSAIGLQSFGGGASTLLLIRRAFVERRGWVEADEFTRFWNLCQFTPGINLVALTVLIGRKLGGAWGIPISLVGLLLPSATVTCGLAIGYQTVQHSPVIHALLRGVVPATAGIMAVVALDYVMPLFERARAEGIASVSLSVALVVGSALAIILGRLSVVLVLVAVALIGVALFTSWRTAAPAHPVPDPTTEGWSS